MARFKEAPIQGPRLDPATALAYDDTEQANRIVYESIPPDLRQHSRISPPQPREAIFRRSAAQEARR